MYNTTRVEYIIYLKHDNINVFIMKNKVLLLLFGCSLLSLASSAQDKRSSNYQDMMEDNSINFYTVCEAAEEYFETVDRVAKGSGWKNYQRWKVANEYKYYPSGDRDRIDPEFVQKEYKAFLKNNQSKNKLFNAGGWQELGPLIIDSITGHYAAGFGRVEEIYVAPTDTNIIYIGSRSGGLWKTNDGGVSWTQGGTDNILASGVNAISASPTNPDSILINVRNSGNGYSHGLYRSIDGANTWTQSNFNPTTVGKGGFGSTFRIYEVAYHPRVPNVILICTSTGIYRSDDNLQTWTRTLAGDQITDIEFHPVDDSIVYIYNNSGSNVDYVFRSLDQGISFTPSNIITDNDGMDAGEISISALCPNCVYYASDSGVWKSIDTGLNFTFLSSPPTASYCRAFAVNDLDTSNMIYGYLDLERTVDGGKNFNKATYWSLGNTNGSGSGHQISYNTSTDYIHADLRKALCYNGAFYVATDGFMCKSNDGGITWQRLTEGVNIRENYRLGTSQSNHYMTVCGSQDNGSSLRIKDQWVEFYGADGMEAIVNPSNDKWLIASLQSGGRRRSINQGLTTNSATPSGSSSGYWTAPLAYDPNHQLHIYDFRDSVYKSTDFGISHTTLGGPSTFSAKIELAAIAENNTNIIVIAQDEHIEKSTDGGLTFSSIRNNLPNRRIRDIAFDPHNDDVMIVVYGTYSIDYNKVFITTNGGTSWTNITANLGNMPIQSVVIDHTPDANIYLGAEIGIYTKPMAGTNWNLYNTGLPNMSIGELEINNGSNTLKAATWGRGLWEYNLVGRQDYPAIVETTIPNPYSYTTPKKGVDQYVSSKISYDQNLTAVYTEWSLNAPTFGNVIQMSNTTDSTWVSNNPLPDAPEGTLIYYKVFAVGNNNDTSETYKFMYEVRPFVYCAAGGTVSNGNKYIDNVSLHTLNNSSGNDTFTYYNNNTVILNLDSTYTLSATSNSNSSYNDYGAWIDYNRDAEFTPDESILLSMGSGNSASSTFTVPATARLYDTLRMRVRLSYWNTPQICGNQWGEVEDYPIVLIPSNASPLPLESVSFGALKHPNNNKQSLVHWTVDKDASHVRYEVYHATGSSNFKLLNSIDISSDKKTHYQIIHPSPSLGANYYKLKIQDINSDTYESKWAVVNFDEINFEKIIIHPNPANDKINFKFSTIKPYHYELSNQLGQILKQGIISSNNPQLDISNLSNGLYYIRIGGEVLKVVKED